MFNYKVPGWVRKMQVTFKSATEIPDSAFLDLNSRLHRVISPVPEVSVVITAFNEEINIVQCINSLSYATSDIPFEIIVINNNSSDKTQYVLDKMAVKNYFQPIQGCGPARQLGQEHARGKYILIADADCIYPEGWITQMMKTLKRPGVVCVYGRYSFIPDLLYKRSQLYLLETLKDVAAELRHFKRPYLNAYGISMGYVKEYGLKAGYVMHNVRGEDGRLAFDLMKYGKIKQVKSTLARPWTGTRTLAQDGPFYKALSERILREIRRFSKLLSKEKPHRTKKSTNN